MKIKHFGIAVLVLLISVNIWAILTEVPFLKNTTFILFFFTAILLVVNRYRKFGKNLYLFLGLITLSYLIRYFQGDYYSYEISLVLLGLANVVLILDASRYFEIKNGGNYMLLFFTAIVGINAALLGFHLMGIKENISSDLVFSVYLLYYINLLILGIVALIYYLNSYSRKAMYFISLSLGIVFADVLRDMIIFLPPDLSVEIAESLIRMGCAVFAVMYFVTEEKQLRLANLI